MQDCNKDNEQIEREKMKTLLTSTQFLTNGLGLIGCAIFILGALVSGQGLTHVSPWFTTVTVGLWVASGVFIVIRQEVPRPGSSSIKGVMAVIAGVFTILVFGVAEIILLYNLFVSIIYTGK